MNRKELLSKSAYWSKWLLLGFCVSHICLTLPDLPTSSVILVIGTTVVFVIDWLNKQRG